MLFVLTSVLRGGGPGRALCTPTFHGLSDGPFRRIPFRLRALRRHSYRDVLLFADERQLLTTARELLQHPKQIKKKSFWTIYSKRIKASLFIISPSVTATLLKSFHVHHEDTGIFVAAAAVLPLKMKDADGKALVTLTEIFSVHLPAHREQQQLLQQPQQPQNKESHNIFKAIAEQIPYMIHQLSCNDILRILKAFNHIHFSDPLLCRLFASKLITYSNLLSHHDIAAAASSFAAQGFRSVSLYNALKTQAVEQHTLFELSSLYELLNGFYQNAVDYDELLEAFSGQLLQFTHQLSSKQRRVIGQMIRESHRPLPELRKAFLEAGEI